MNEPSAMRRAADALEQAKGLLEELETDAISLDDFKLQMVVLAGANPDILEIQDARDDPQGQSERLTDKLFALRVSLYELGLAE